MELTKDIIERIYSIIEDSRTDGRIRKGVNEVTKSLERGEAKLSIAASDVSPGEIIQHLALLAKDKEIMHVEVPSKAELGAAAGLPVATAAVAIANPGEAKKKLNNLIEDIQILIKAEEKPKKAEKPAEEKPAEKKAPKDKVEKPKEKPAKKEVPKDEPKAEPEAVEEPAKEEAPAEEKKEEVKEVKADSKEATEEKVEEAPVVEKAEEKPAETEVKEEKPKKKEAETSEEKTE